MKTITLSFDLDDELFLKVIRIERNDTDLTSDSKLMYKVCSAAVRSLDRFQDSALTQDLLRELKIPTSKDNED